MNHLTFQQLQDYADKLPTITDSREIELHLRMCNECSDRLNAFQNFDSVLRRVPLERVSGEFTHNVMKKLRLNKPPSYAWKIFESLAPILALILIAVIVYALFQYTGTYDKSEMKQSLQLTQSVYNKLGGSVTEGLNLLNGWMGKYLSFAFAKNSYGLTTFLLVFFGAVALLDKYLLRPLFKKRVI